MVGGLTLAIPFSTLARELEASTFTRDYLVDISKRREQILVTLLELQLTLERMSGLCFSTTIVGLDNLTLG
jgi:hypothetical protein